MNAAPAPVASQASRPTLPRQLGAEFIGTAALLCAVIGSGIMTGRLSGGNNGLPLLANTLATVFALYVLIEVLGPVSGAHFNRLVTLTTLFFRPKEALASGKTVLRALHQPAPPDL